MQQEETTTINSQTQAINVNGVICMIKYLNQVLYGPINPRLLVTIAMPARNKIFVTTADVSERHTVASHRTRNPVAYSVLSALVTGHVEIS